MSIAVKMDCPGLSDKVIPAQFVRIHHAGKVSAASAGPESATSGSEGGDREPRITLVKDGDTVKTIEIKCTCGALIRLDCEF